MNYFQIFVFFIVLCFAKAKNSNNSIRVCENFEMDHTISILDAQNCSSIRFKITASQQRKMPYKIEDKFFVFFRIQNACKYNNSTRYQLLFVWKYAKKRKIVVKLKQTQGESVAVCGKKIYKVHQKFTINKDDLYGLMVDVDWCKFIQFVAAFGDIYLFQIQDYFDSEEELGIEPWKSSVFANHQLGYMSIQMNFTTSNFSKSQGKVKLFKRDCNTAETENYIKFYVIGLIVIPLQGILLVRCCRILIKRIIAYANRNKVFPFTY